MSACSRYVIRNGKMECAVKPKVSTLSILRRILISFTNFNAKFLYSITIYVLHYNPRHVSSINMSICRRKNCIITAFGIITLCKRLYGMQVESSVLSTGILYSCLQSATIQDAVIIQFFLLQMGMLMLETCRGL